MSDEKRNEQGLTEQEFLDQYNPKDYERPSVTVDTVLIGMDKRLNGLKVLLIKRKNHPFIDTWAFPGGFVDIAESAYDAANRELNEETGLKNIYMEQLYTMTRPNRDPRMRVIDIAYMGLFNMESVEDKLEAGDDAKEAVWFNLSFNEKEISLINDDRNIEIKYKLHRKAFRNGVVSVYDYTAELVSNEKLAFDHIDILITAINRLKSKVLYSDAAFNFVEKEFTLPDIQRVYEIILGRELYKTSFRNMINGKVKETGNKKKSITCNKTTKTYRYVRGDYNE